MRARREWVARLLVAGLVLGPLAAVLVAPRLDRSGTIVLAGAMPEQGGWRPLALTAEAGVPLRLRLTSSDVVHGFAVAGIPHEPVDVHPGEVRDIELRFPGPGTYTFYCTRWCGLNHWRMRGTITVSGSAGTAADTAPPAPYLALGLDLDAPHPPAVWPSERPDARAASAALVERAARGFDSAALRRRSPAEVWSALRGEAAWRRTGDQQLWNAVAALWLRAGSSSRDSGRALYQRNCAACHGTGGAGDGVMAEPLRASLGSAAGAAAHHAYPPAGRPADFTARDLLGASPAVLHGKIVRGGMGTGMPAWGPIFTDAEAWSLVYYVYALNFGALPKENE